MTKTYEITGIRYHISDSEDLEANTRLAEAFVRDLPIGTSLVLTAEPDNPWDEKAIAVYMGYTRLIGYVKHELCDDIHKLLDDDGQADATVTGNDGHLTVYFTVDNAPDDSPILPHTRPRQLPESPLSETVFMPFSQQENSLRIVATRLLRLKLTTENIPQIIELSEVYLPLASLSFTYEDSHWRNEAYQLVSQALSAKDELHLSDEQMARLGACRKRLHAIQGDFHRTHSRWQGKLFDSQLKALGRKGGEAEVLFKKYHDYYKKCTHEIKAAMFYKEERDRLRKWFEDMSWPELHNYTDHHQLAKKLNYLGISRRELYDVYSVILLIGQIDKILVRKGNENQTKNTEEDKKLLKTELALKYWKRLQDAGFVDENYMLCKDITRQDAMLIADLFSEKIGMTKSKWKPFEELWNIKHLAQEKQSWKDCKTQPRYEAAIRKIFTDETPEY